MSTQIKKNKKITVKWSGFYLKKKDVCITTGTIFNLSILKHGVHKNKNLNKFKSKWKMRVIMFVNYFACTVYLSFIFIKLRLFDWRQFEVLISNFHSC